MKQEKLRYIVLGSVVGLIFAFYIGTMLKYQLVQGEKFAKEAVGQTSITQLVPAARGEILDCEGRPFTGNKTAFQVTIDSNYFEPRQLNPLILRVTELFTSFHCDWLDELPLTREAPYRFTEDESAVRKLKKELGVSENAPVEDVLYWLRDRYQLESRSDAEVLAELKERNGLEQMSTSAALDWYRTEESLEGKSDAEVISHLRDRYNMHQYTEEEVRILAGVRYTMSLAEMSASTPYTFATDVSEELVACVEERGRELPGVLTSVAAVREYVSGDLAPHVLGLTGPLTAAEYAQKKEEGVIYSRRNPSGYRMSDEVGISGIEKAFEKELRGQNGQRTLTIDQDGEVVSADMTTPAVPGSKVMLTINQDVQAAAKKALEERIATLNTRAPGYGREANAGAVVAIDVKTGGVIAMVSYPDYDLSTYYDQYSELLNMQPSPLLNRAAQGLYTVGSTYKPAVAVAGLDAGLITPQSTVNCTGRYTFYHDYQPRCEGVHNIIDVKRSLQVSCNIFYYDLGRRMGIEAINKYSSKLGLGHPTGIEIPESAGQLSCPATREAIGEEWYPSYDMQSAIGQLDNQFTILQMASYTATLANRGERLQVHLVDKIWDYNMENVLYEAKPTVVDTIPAAPEVWDTVREGMVRSSYAGGTSWGTWGETRGQTWLGSHGVMVEVASKTGSPQMPGGLVNSAFICYAPADDPQIAVAVMIEKGYEGDRAAPIAKAVLTEYFFGEHGTMRDRMTVFPPVQDPKDPADVPQETPQETPAADGPNP